MKFNYFSSFIKSLLFILFFNSIVIAQNANKGIIKGFIKKDSTWSSKIYLSYIPTFGEMYSMSSEMIIAETTIDSLGYFELELDFLPKAYKVYRLHIVKKSDSKVSLIIGGNNENYLLLMANRDSKINFRNTALSPPFRHVIFNGNNKNSNFQKITDLVYEKDSISDISGASKRKFINDRLNEELLKIADSSTNSILSLYAIYKSNFESNYTSNEKFYKSFLKKWSKTENSYINDFRKKLPIKEPKSNSIGGIILSIILIAIAFLLGKYGRWKSRRIKKLSVQERKIFDLLIEGATNKDISEEFNIGISTVKSHVSSILTKLKVKSRKEIMNLKKK